MESKGSGRRSSSKSGLDGFIRLIDCERRRKGEDKLRDVRLVLGGLESRLVRQEGMLEILERIEEAMEPRREGEGESGWPRWVDEGESGE